MDTNTMIYPMFGFERPGKELDKYLGAFATLEAALAWFHRMELTVEEIKDYYDCVSGEETCCWEAYDCNDQLCYRLVQDTLLKGV